MPVESYIVVYNFGHYCSLSCSQEGKMAVPCIDGKGKTRSVFFCRDLMRARDEGYHAQFLVNGREVSYEEAWESLGGHTETYEPYTGSGGVNSYWTDWFDETGKQVE